MLRKFSTLVILIMFFFKTGIIAQSVKYVVAPVQFSTRIYDEFSPVYYKDGLVFCSNQFDNSVVSYNNDQTRLFKIFYVKRRGDSGWNQSKSMASEIATSFNDGPATFNSEGNVMYFSRNNSVRSSMKNINDTTNKLGIYSSELNNGIWANIKPFRYNNIKYSFSTPSLSPDGERLYFSSDMPGGSGGMDLYYCELINNEWSAPVNLGPAINTSKNESFPFASAFRKLFFASDGLQGFGQKDIFYTQQINGEWITPVHLDSAINSPFDDFGLVTDSTLENGFFSTNRRKTDDIFSFTSAPQEFSECDTIKKNRYCFTLYDEQHRLIDTIPVTYSWDFGEEGRQTGVEVYHCFPVPGHFKVLLNITDNITGDTIAKQVEYNVDLVNFIQPVINSPELGLAGKSISFEGNISDLKDTRITDFFWDFGDGFKQGGPDMTHIYNIKGEYTVRLGLLEGKNSTGEVKKICVMKKIKIN